MNPLKGGGPVVNVGSAEVALSFEFPADSCTEATYFGCVFRVDLLGREFPPSFEFSMFGDLFTLSFPSFESVTDVSDGVEVTKFEVSSNGVVVSGDVVGFEGLPLFGLSASFASSLR